jgi:hypothetical protein
MNSFNDYLKNKNDLDNKSLDNFVVNKKPKNGDMAYSMYDGKMYVGMLAFNDGMKSQVMKIDPAYAKNACPHLIGASGYRMPGYLVFPPIGDVKNPDGRKTLSVGYDGPIVWDSKKGMFYAQPDKD